MNCTLCQFDVLHCASRINMMKKSWHHFVGCIAFQYFISRHILHKINTFASFHFCQLRAVPITRCTRFFLAGHMAIVCKIEFPRGNAHSQSDTDLCEWRNNKTGRSIYSRVGYRGKKSRVITWFVWMLANKKMAKIRRGKKWNWNWTLIFLPLSVP